jgi:hypothetical protein
LADLDGDGRVDILSGSWPGEIYWFRRQADRSFAKGEKLLQAGGKEINLGHASAAFAADFDGDGRMDLIVGTLMGKVSLLPGVASKAGPRFGPAVEMTAAGKPITVNSDAAPVVADWDGDGKPDLIVAAEDGSVIWCRNVGTKGKPALAAPKRLVPKSTLDRTYGDKRKPTWGGRVKACVFDWDGDGRPDLLLGDYGGYFEGKPSTTTGEAAEDDFASAALPGLRAKWAEAFRAYRDEKDATRAADRRAEVTRLRDEIARVQEIQTRYRSQHQKHGHVWLFQRKPERKP